MALTRKKRSRGRRQVTSLRRKKRRGKKRRREDRLLTAREFQEGMQEMLKLFTPEPMQKMKSLEKKIAQSTMSTTPGRASKPLRDRLQRERETFAATHGTGALNTSFNTPMTAFFGGARPKNTPPQGGWGLPMSPLTPDTPRRPAREQTGGPIPYGEEDESDQADVQPDRGGFHRVRHVEGWLAKKNMLDDKSRKIYRELRAHLDPETGTVHGEPNSNPYSVLEYLYKPTNDTPPVGTGAFLRHYALNPDKAPMTIEMNGVNVSRPYIQSSKALSSIEVEFRDYMKLVKKMNTPEQLRQMTKQLNKLPNQPTRRQKKIIRMSIRHGMPAASPKSPKKVVNKMDAAEFIHYLENVNRILKETT